MNSQSDMSTKARLEELEARVALQDKAINDLSQEIYEQQKQIKHLQATCKLLIEQSREQPATEDHEINQPPPHY
jgi:uncharacterized coiled-coil protein SlyX